MNNLLPLRLSSRPALCERFIHFLRSTEPPRAESSVVVSPERYLRAKVADLLVTLGTGATDDAPLGEFRDDAWTRRELVPALRALALDEGEDVWVRRRSLDGLRLLDVDLAENEVALLLDEWPRRKSCLDSVG